MSSSSLASYSMKSHHHKAAKGGGGSGRAVSTHQAAFELKQRVVLSLNKLADRDTYQIGVDELERTIDGLSPEGIPPFLSCITDTDSEQKSAVRKECIRMMGTLARFHGGLMAPHLGKMVASIVKRLKDADSVVRDACVETVGILASNVGSCGGINGGGAFVVLAKPLFEALGEQNRHVQSGSALCLARVIDEASDLSVSILPQMLTRVLKLLKNPHFMAKPALIELIRSIIQAGGASTEYTLSAAVSGILEALKSNDWTTRKAASLALAGMAATAGSLLRSFRTSCICSLEGCRFDKVKPVRDAVMQALECWKSLPGSDSPEPSEAGSSTKENFNGADYPDITCASDGGWKDTSFRKAGPVSALSGNSSSSIKKRTPFTVRKITPNHVQNGHHSRTNDWHIEISLPKNSTMPSVDTHQEESEGSCVTKSFERTKNATRGPAIGYDRMDDKPECSSISDLVSGSFETKHVTVARGSLGESNSMNVARTNHRSACEDIDPEGDVCSMRMKDSRSLDSTVTELSPQGLHACCLHSANELTLIRKQLFEIETRQSNLLDLLQVFMGNSMDSLSTLQSKVHNLEHAVDKIAQSIGFSKNHPSMANSKLLKKNQSVSSSPRLSTCTPRPSVDTNYRQPSLFSMKGREMWGGETGSSKSRSSTSVKEDSELWKDPTLNIIRNPTAKGIPKISGRCPQSSLSSQTRKTSDVSASNASDKQNKSDVKCTFWKRIKDFVCAGDIESAYLEALGSSDDLVLIELMDRTGPVLERLSHEVASEILSTLAVHVLEKRFMDSIIPWLQQVVDLSAAHELSRHHLSSKARREFLLAIEEAAAVDFLDPLDRVSFGQLAAKLRHLWFEASLFRKTSMTK